MQQSAPKHLPDKVLQALNIHSGYKVTSLAGNENDNYLVRTTDRELVIKRLHSAYSVAETEAEGMYRSRLTCAGLPVTGYLPLDGGHFVLTIDGANYVAVPYIKGGAPTYSQGLAAQTAELLARIHSVDSVGMDERSTWFRESYITDSLKHISDQYADAKHAFADRRAHMPDFWSTDLPRGIVHGDLHNDNIIVDNEGKIVSIIDWEEAAVQPLILDIALTVRFMSFRKDVCNETIFHTFMDTYQSIRPLTKLENELLEPALNYTALILSVWTYLKYSEEQMDQETFADLGSRYKLNYTVPRIK